MNEDLAIAQKEVEHLKRIAEQFPLSIEVEDKPGSRHWADLPEGIRICFTKRYDAKMFFYRLSVSQTSGNRVDDAIIIALLKMLEAPHFVNEVPPIANLAVRHFIWDVERKLM